MNLKVLASLLAIYLFGIFLVPCTDMPESEVMKPCSTVNVNNHSHKHSEKTDLCSPFCYCNCCGRITGFVFKWEAIHFVQVLLIKPSKNIPQYISKFIPQYIGNIWQPPKINV